MSDWEQSFYPFDKIKAEKQNHVASMTISLPKTVGKNLWEDVTFHQTAVDKMCRHMATRQLYVTLHCSGGVVLKDT